MMLRLITYFIVLFPQAVFAAEAQTLSTSGAMLKMVIGLGLVLLVMFGITWFAKRFLPNTGVSNSVIKVVGGTNVGSRERVVVLEVAGRWIVVGVGNGQVNAIADLAPGQALDEHANLAKPVDNIQTDRFKQWLNKAMKKHT